MLTLLTCLLLPLSSLSFSLHPVRMSSLSSGRPPPPFSPLVPLRAELQFGTVEVVTDPKGSLPNFPNAAALPDDTLSLYRFKLWWMRPSFGPSINPATFLILTKNPDTDTFTLLLPAPPAYFSTNADGKVTLQPLTPPSSPTPPPLFYYTGTHHNPFDLLKEGVSLFAASPELRSYRTERRSPLEGLGWCTWNSFYTDLGKGKVVSALKGLNSSLGTKRKKVNWVLVDDGWQSVNVDTKVDGSQWGAKLAGLGADENKFPPGEGLKAMVEEIKGEGAEKVLAWHALGGTFVIYLRSVFVSLSSTVFPDRDHAEQV